MEKKEIINLIHNICFEMMDSIDTEEISFHDDLVLWINKRICEEIKKQWKESEQEPRKGEWTKISNVVPCMNCPICGSTFTLILGGDKMHYCPNCGAKMESEDKE